MTIWRGTHGYLRGITLVELVISMVILSVISGVAAQSFLLVLRADREMEDRSAAMRTLQLVRDEVQRNVSNLLPAQMGTFVPFAEVAEPGGRTVTYKLLTRLPETFSREEAAGIAQAMLVEFTISSSSEGAGRLTYSKQAIGPGGRLGEPLSGVLADNLAFFRLSAVANTEEGEPGDSQVVVPKAIDLSMQFSLPEVQEEFSVVIPVTVRADTQNKRDNSDSGGQSTNAAHVDAAPSRLSQEGGPK